MPVIAVDTSVAVPLLVASHSRHAVVAQWAKGRKIGLCGHALAETYSVLTRLPGDARVHPADAVELIDENFTAPLQLGARAARAAHREFARKVSPAARLMTDSLHWRPASTERSWLPGMRVHDRPTKHSGWTPGFWQRAPSRDGCAVGPSHRYSMLATDKAATVRRWEGRAGRGSGIQTTAASPTWPGVRARSWSCVADRRAAGA